ncbi:MAG: hypothetical protein EOO21_02475 [Comamonadaceae bacterium]|nr:MAG: hypothetical protein EOO21_02475 [Comamonadaceae bacterium]
MTQAPAPAAAALTPEDFDALDAELDLLRESDEEIPQWEFCEGFLVALVVMRREVPPEEYWPVLLGEDFKPMAHMEFVWRWRRRREEITAALDAPVELLEDERTYQPEALDTRSVLHAGRAHGRGPVAHGRQTDRMKRTEGTRPTKVNELPTMSGGYASGPEGPKCRLARARTRDAVQEGASGSSTHAETRSYPIGQAPRGAAVARDVMHARSPR